MSNMTNLTQQKGGRDTRIKLSGKQDSAEEVVLSGEGEMIMLSVKNVRKSYRTGKQTYEVLKGVSFEVEKGEFVAVMGPSGSGKTTLLNCISCYIPFEDGEITLEGVKLSELNSEELAKVRNQKLGFVFQDFMLLDGLKVQDNIMLPRIIEGEVAGDMETETKRLGQIFGISHIMNKYPAEISGGEKQRTAVARALMNHPLLMLADEPTGNLDSKSSQAVIDSFNRARHDLDATIFMVTHDSYAASFCDRVIILKDGEIFAIAKNQGSRMMFQEELLKVIQQMSNDTAEAESGASVLGGE